MVAGGGSLPAGSAARAGAEPALRGEELRPFKLLLIVTGGVVAQVELSLQREEKEPSGQMGGGEGAGSLRSKEHHFLDRLSHLLWEPVVPHDHLGLGHEAPVPGHHGVNAGGGTQAGEKQTPPPPMLVSTHAGCLTVASP